MMHLFSDEQDYEPKRISRLIHQIERYRQEADPANPRAYRLGLAAYLRRQVSVGDFQFWQALEGNEPVGEHSGCALVG